MLHQPNVTNLDDDDEMEECDTVDLSLTSKSQKWANNATISSSYGSSGVKAEQDKIGEQLRDYINSEGIFEFAVAIRQRKKKSSVEWRRIYDVRENGACLNIFIARKGID
ncbi:hypothetical protein K7X08_032480 [Anisodus acutangulus]|uniref:Uncharacterized protein n=1 Tax=Anisodus acutangulus TaxID=402998 RepID=A0A9Q1LQZ5_9SOLA|nr:hypothetical protein K7X08_032480 [Anisodus acutangulus]